MANAQNTQKTTPKDAGAAFVLESKGTWLHAGYHLTSSTVAPAILTLPYAMANLGWIPGLIYLSLVAAVSFYAYCLLSAVLERMEDEGNRFIRFRDLSKHLLGSRWTSSLVVPIQFIVCFATVVASILPGGQSIKGIYILYHPNGGMKLYQFMMIFGAVTLIICQIPSFHALRHINLLSILLCLGYSFCAVAGSIIAGHSKDHHPASYTVVGAPVQKMFQAFSSISIISATYGNAVIAEIQATLAPPVRGKMMKGLCLCYCVVLFTFFPVAASGYWAFGNNAAGNIFNSMVTPGGLLLIPRWLFSLSNLFIIMQLLAVAMIYMQPMFEVLEGRTADVDKGRFSIRNVLPRFFARSVFVILATFLAALLPFFGDIVAFIGAIGYTPLDYVLPMLFHILVFKPSTKSVSFWLNSIILLTYCVVTVLGSVACLHAIVHDANTYKLFANV